VPTPSIEKKNYVIVCSCYFMLRSGRGNFSSLTSTFCSSCHYLNCAPKLITYLRVEKSRECKRGHSCPEIHIGFTSGKYAKAV
jgi:hypothetical protein